MEWTAAVRQVAGDALPKWLMSYLSWRVGRRMARNVASAASDVAQEESRGQARTASVAIAFCFHAGATLMHGMLVVLRWIAFAIAKLGII
jgi:hypothetical protein